MLFLRLSISERKSNLWICWIEIGFSRLYTAMFNNTSRLSSSRRKLFQSTPELSAPDSLPLTSSTSYTNLSVAELAQQPASNYTVPLFFCNFTVIIPSRIWHLSSTSLLECKRKTKTVARVSRESGFLNMFMSGIDCAGFGRLENWI